MSNKSIKFLYLLFSYLTINVLSAQNYYLYVASESDDTVSLLKFDGNSIKEIKRINVGFYPTEIEGPHGITVDPSGDFWYVTCDVFADDGEYEKNISQQQQQRKQVQFW